MIIFPMRGGGGIEQWQFAVIMILLAAFFGYILWSYPPWAI